MRAGDLDRRIVVEQFTNVPGTHGDPDAGTWATYLSAWAMRTPERVMESYREQQELAQADVGFRIRWRTGITPKMRVKESNNDSPETFNYYDILGTLEIGRREGLDVLTKRNVS